MAWRDSINPIGTLFSLSHQRIALAGSRETSLKALSNSSITAPTGTNKLPITTNKHLRVGWSQTRVWPHIDFICCTSYKRCPTHSHMGDKSPNTLIHLAEVVNNSLGRFVITAWRMDNEIKAILFRSFGTSHKPLNILINNGKERRRCLRFYNGKRGKITNNAMAGILGKLLYVFIKKGDGLVSVTFVKNFIPSRYSSLQQHRKNLLFLLENPSL